MSGSRMILANRRMKIYLRSTGKHPGGMLRKGHTFRRGRRVTEGLNMSPKRGYQKPKEKK